MKAILLLAVRYMESLNNNLKKTGFRHLCTQVLCDLVFLSQLNVFHIKNKEQLLPREDATADVLSIGNKPHDTVLSVRFFFSLGRIKNKEADYLYLRAKFIPMDITRVQ